MKGNIYFILDTVCYAVQSCMLVQLMQEILKKRYDISGRPVTGWILGLQYLGIQLFLTDAPIVKQLLYGDDMIIRDSGRSIWLVVISMMFTVIFAMALYQGKRLGVLYLVTVFYGLRELVRFTLYSFGAWLLDYIVTEHLYRLWEQGLLSIDSYAQYLSMVEVVWNFLMMCGTLLILGWCLKRYRNSLKIPDYQMHTSEVCFLLVPAVTGLVLGIMLRSILFVYSGNQIETIVMAHPEMNVMIPCMTLLCILSILLSAGFFGKMVEEREKRWEAELYKSRMNEMEEHLTQVERLYDGIRGMKHDMHHYIADMEALCRQDGVMTSENTAAFRQYLSSLQGAMEQLETDCKTGNPITDVVLGRYIRLAGEKNIATEMDFIYPKQLEIEAFDIGIILNNGMENAIEACEKIEETQRYLKLNSFRKGNMFFLVIENSFNGIVPKEENGLFSTSKEDKNAHGYGMKNIKSCAEKYYGKVEVQTEGKRFCMTVMLQENHNLQRCEGTE